MRQGKIGRRGNLHRLTRPYPVLRRRTNSTRESTNTLLRPSAHSSLPCHLAPVFVKSKRCVSESQTGLDPVLSAGRFVAEAPTPEQINRRSLHLRCCLADRRRKSGNERGTPWSFNLADDPGYAGSFFAAGAGCTALEEPSGFGSVAQAPERAGRNRNPVSSRLGRPAGPGNSRQDLRARATHIPFLEISISFPLQECSAR